MLAPALRASVLVAPATLARLSLATRLARGTVQRPLVDCDALVSSDSICVAALHLDATMLASAALQSAYRAVWGEDFAPASGVSDLDVVHALLVQCGEAPTTTARTVR